MTEQTSKCLAWTPNTGAHSSWRWKSYEIWRQPYYLFISSPARHFHGPICFNPRECCRRNRFLFTLIKIIFCGARSNGQNVTSMTLSFFRPTAITQQASLLFRAAKDKSPSGFSLLVLHMCCSKLGFMELTWQCQYIFGLLKCLFTTEQKRLL